MHNLIAETAQATLRQYANYREKQLLAAGETAACFVSVITRLRRAARRFVWFCRLLDVSLASFIAWLAYTSGVRGNITLLLCFAPTFLIHSGPQTTVLWTISTNIAKLETIAELWHAQNVQSQPRSDSSPKPIAQPCASAAV